MVSFTDHYNAISIDRFTLKTKIAKDLSCFNNSVLCKPEFSSTAKTFFIKHRKNNHSSASDRCKYTKSCFKENTKLFSENSVTQENIRILRLKEDCKTYVKMETSNQKLNQ